LSKEGGYGGGSDRPRKLPSWSVALKYVNSPNEIKAPLANHQRSCECGAARIDLSPAGARFLDGQWPHGALQANW